MGNALSLSAGSGTERTRSEPEVRVPNPEQVVAPNAAAPFALLNPYGTNEWVEPAVAFHPEGWNGHNYWMVVTPYPAADATKENPSVYYSDDGDTWTAPAGVTNPIFATPTPGTNSDPGICFGPDGRLYLFYNTSFEAANRQRTYVSSSADGVNWTARTLILDDDLSTTRRPSSPSPVYHQGTWFLYQVDVRIPRSCMRYTASSPTGPWSAPATVNAAIAGRDIFHFNVKRWNNQWHMIAQDTTAAGGPGAGSFYFGISDDGINWTMGSKAMLAPTAAGWDQTGLYRADFAPAIRNGQIGYDVWYGAEAPTYRIGRTFAPFSRAQARPAARVYHTAAQSVPTGGVLDLAFNSERFDNDNIHDTAANTQFLTCRTPGIYQVTAHVRFASNAVGQRQVRIMKNGTISVAKHATLGVTGGNPTFVTCTALVQLAAGDTIKCSVFQDSGGALNVDLSDNVNAQDSTELSMVLVSA